MSRDEAIKRQAAMFTEGVTLPEICGWLRTGVNGSADEWPAHRVRETVSMLKARLETWRPPAADRQRSVDECVKQLVAATVREVESYDWWQEGPKTTYTHDAKDLRETLARIRRTDGRHADAVVIVWERARELIAHLDSLEAEVERLKRGELTEEELQALCHAQGEDCPERFARGCVEYNRRLFGGRSRLAVLEPPTIEQWQAVQRKYGPRVGRHEQEDGTQPKETQ